MRSLRVFALLALATAVSGCGAKGPLVLPPAQPRAAAAPASTPAPASTAAAPSGQP